MSLLDNLILSLNEYINYRFRVQGARPLSLKIRPANEQNLVELVGWFLTETDAITWAGPAAHFRRWQR